MYTRQGKKIYKQGPRNNTLEEMNKIYMYFNVWACLHVYLSTQTSAQSMDTIINWDPPVHVVRLTLSSCDGACRCREPCVHAHYNNGHLYCELAKPMPRDRNLYLDGSIGYLTQETNGRLASRDVASIPAYECLSLLPPICPSLDINDTAMVLSNLTNRSQRLIQYTWSPVQGGWNLTSCDAYSLCTHYDTRSTGSTMRRTCHINSECVDAESECRDGQCWCKPGLSHDPDSLSCVQSCPAQYGSTFQIVKHMTIIWFTMWVPASTGNDINTYMEHCLSYRKPEYVCKYAALDTYDGFCELNPSKKGESSVPLTTFVVLSDYLQRDCKSGLN